MITKEFLRKVVTLGNKLAKGNRNKSEAFKKAWVLVRTGRIELPVKGVTFGNRQEALRRLSFYNPRYVYAVMVPETENQFDPTAVAVKVMTSNGKGIYHLGYLPKEETALASVCKISSIRVLEGDVFGARILLKVSGGN